MKIEDLMWLMWGSFFVVAVLAMVALCGGVIIPHGKLILACTDTCKPYVSRVLDDDQCYCLTEAGDYRPAKPVEKP